MKIIAQLIESDKLPKTDDNSIQRGLTITFTIIGAVAFLMLVIAGVKYVFARGDSNKITEAKNLIVYTIIGLVIASLASAFVNLLIKRL